MKNFLSLAAAAMFLLCTPLGSMAQPAAAPAAKTQADLDYDTMYSGWRTPMPAGLARNDPAYWQFQDRVFRKFSEDARAFLAKYPDDPRRRDGIIQSSFTRPWFMTGVKPEFATRPTDANLVVDQTALNAWRAKQLELLAVIVEAPDATARQRSGAMYCLLVDSRSDARDRGIPFDLAPIRALVDRVLEKMPDERALPAVDQYLTALKQESPEAAKAFEAKLQSIPSLAAALTKAETAREAAAAEKSKKLADLTAVTFTAADGRDVSIAALKGKVVLIDFWATWCGPCIAELPNVVANYEKYHDKGFEVVGVTLENPNAKPGDTAEQTAQKLAAAKEKMLAFTKTHHMPWPQYFDGKWWKNDLAVKFNIEAIPAMFLLDQQGNIVSTEARGPKLEQEIKRLLKL